MGADRLPWFRCRPDKLLGALAGMQPDHGYVYTVVLMRLYEAGGPVQETSGTLSRRTGIPSKRAAEALAWLIEAGKLEVTADGRLDSHTTHAEIQWQADRSAQVTKAGKKRGENVATNKANVAEKKAPDELNGKAQQNQGNGAAAAEQLRGDIDKERDKSSVGAGAPTGADAPQDPTAAQRDLFRRGKEVLGAKAGGVIANLLRCKGNNPALARAAIEQASQAQDPKEYIGRVIHPQKDCKNGHNLWNAALADLDERPYTGQTIETSFRILS